MKYLIVLTAALFLTACDNASTDTLQADETPSNITTIDARNAGGQPIDPAAISRLGETCGPSSQKLCASGLSCQFEGTQQESGKCLPIIVNPDLECDNAQNPVCGVLGNNKNGYLNECFAQRYGAVVVNQGLCKADATIAHNCEARTYSIGNCQESFTGAWVNPDSGECEAVSLVGCGADIPFESVEACEKTC